MSFIDFDSEMSSFGLGNLSGKAISNQSSGGFDALGGFGGAAGAAPGSGLNFGGTDGMGGNIFGKGGMASTALGGLKALGSLWNSFQQNKMAKKSFKLQKRAFETNLENTTQVYNTALEDRIRSRYVAENRPEQADAYIEKHRL